MKKEQITIGGKPVSKLRASLLLASEAFRFLKADMEILWIPIITACISLGLYCALGLLGFFIGFGGNIHAAQDTQGDSFIVYAFLFGAYVVGAFTLALSEAGTAHIVYARIKGGNASLGQGLSSAFSHWFSLLMWSMITSTVGVVLRIIAERSRLLMMIVVAIIGSAWSVLTYFVVPAMVIDHKSAFASIGHSASVFKKTWGETLVSNISIGLVFFGINTAIIFAGIGLVIAVLALHVPLLAVPIMILAVVLILLSALFQSALNGVIKILLYVYASENFIPQDFNRELLEKMLSRRPVPPSPLATPIAATDE